MSEQHSLNSVDDSVGNVAHVVEETTDGNSASSLGRDLRQPVVELVLDPKKKSFQITSAVELNHIADHVVDFEAPTRAAFTAENTAATGTEQNATLSKSETGLPSASGSSSSGVQPKKKISFQVTSIESKEGRRRGDSHDDEELNESEFLEEDEAESPDSTLTHALGNGNSRFKLVKIPRYDSKMYTRGRWGCWDFVKPPPSAVPYLNEIPSYNLDLSSERTEAPSTDSSARTAANTAANSLVNSNANVAASMAKENSVETLMSSHESGVHQQLQGASSIVVDPIHDSERNFATGIDYVASVNADERPDFAINNPSGVVKNVETSHPGEQDDDATRLRLNLSEHEFVAQKIEKAMSQVVQIKADLLQNVNADVNKLKQTIEQLTQDNLRLKEENELLKQQLSNQTKPEPI